MTSSTDPDQIRRDIERTRTALSDDVDALAEKVTPARVVERRVEAARGAVTGVKDKVMGAAADSASSVGDTLSEGPEVARRRTRGNPLAAGLIAFGSGWLVSSMLPAGRKERQMAATVKTAVAENSEMITGPLGDAAQAVGENLRVPAQEAVASVKETVSDAAASVQEKVPTTTGT